MSEMSSETILSTLVVNPDPELTEYQLVKLATELAKAQMRPAAIFEAFGITPVQFTKYIETNAYFQKAHAAATLDWNSATSAAKRIKIKSATSLEQSLPTLHERLNNRTEALPAVVETAKLLAKLAGVGEEKQQGGSNERFSININIGAKKIEQAIEPTIDITPQPALEKPSE